MGFYEYSRRRLELGGPVDLGMVRADRGHREASGEVPYRDRVVTLFELEGRHATTSWGA
ncbi:hypothetical protein GCM10010317_103540 [Streptomyces mirabilis]|nr:hypothetical protein GCM10010317_103540 [Streptomyces mirabilis]